MVFEYLGYGLGFVGVCLFMMEEVGGGKDEMGDYGFG